MSQFPKPYHLADETISALNRKAVRRVDQTKQRLITLKFDELNVLQEIDSLYAGLELDNRRAFRKLFHDRYVELWIWLKGTEYGGNLRGNEPDEDILDELIDMALAGLLDEQMPLPGTRTVQRSFVRETGRRKQSIPHRPKRKSSWNWTRLCGTGLRRQGSMWIFARMKPRYRCSRMPESGRECGIRKKTEKSVLTAATSTAKSS